jgi:hypothetical protein
MIALTYLTQTAALALMFGNMIIGSAALRDGSGIGAVMMMGANAVAFAVNMWALIALSRFRSRLRG